MTWKAIARSEQGTSHIHLNMCCQDYGDYKLINNVIIGAVSDGAGSAKFSNIGSQIAVKTALLHLEKWLLKLKQKQPNLKWQKPIPEDKARKVFSGTLKYVVNALNEKLNKNCSLKDLACTLLVFIATPDWIAAMQIGDGFIVVRSENLEYQLLFHPVKGEYANETTFVTSSNAQSEMQVKVLEGNQTFICASTDGLERLAISFHDCKPFPGFFRPFEEGIKIANNLELEAEDIARWMVSEEVNARTDDDKTMLLCIYDGEEKLKDSSDTILTNLNNDKSEINLSRSNPLQPQYNHSRSRFPLTLGVPLPISRSRGITVSSDTFKALSQRPINALTII